VTDGAHLVGIVADVVRLLRAGRDWATRMGELLPLIGERLEVSRVYVFQVHEIAGVGLGQTCLFDWAAPGLHELSGDPRNVDEAVSADPLFAEWTERRRRGETIVGHTRDLAGYLRDDFEHQRIVSFVTIPIMVNGQWWGHIGLDDCERERTWTDGERSVLESVAYLLGNAIELSGSSLMMSEASRLAMLRTAPDGIIVVDEASCVLEFNPAAEAMFGWRREEILGRDINRTIVPRHHRAGHHEGFHRYLAGGTPVYIGRRTETEGLRADGTVFPIELALTEVLVERRRLFVAYVRDLTARKAAEAAAVRQREALHQSEKMSALGSLLAGIAHELNNPLSVVVGRAIMLEEDCADPRQGDQLRRLREAAERCGRIAQTFLKMARQAPADRKATSVDAAIRASHDLVGYAARTGGVTVVLELADGLPPVHADGDQIVQVMVNLMINAVQAMEGIDGPRRLTVRTRHDPARGVVVEVDDTGPGIPDHVMPRIFEPFYTTKPVGTGTGVGLAVSYAMVEAHGGTLTAGNRAGGGARFTVALPAGEAAAAEAGEVVAPPPATGGLSILVVDDEPEVAALLAEILERAGHTVVIAGDGAEALALSEGRAVDAVFCDMRMPVMDGPRLLSAFRAMPGRSTVPFIFVTGDHLGPSAAARPDGCAVVGKPFRPSEVLAALLG
jgi:PAS domain S-box-containing protein